LLCRIVRATNPEHDPEKLVPDLIRDVERSSGKIMLQDEYLP